MVWLIIHTTCVKLSRGQHSLYALAVILQMKESNTILQKQYDGDRNTDTHTHTSKAQTSLHEMPESLMQAQ